jgi:hypothetical protein
VRVASGVRNDEDVRVAGGSPSGRDGPGGDSTINPPCDEPEVTADAAQDPSLAIWTIGAYAPTVHVGNPRHDDMAPTWADLVDTRNNPALRTVHTSKSTARHPGGHRRTIRHLLGG